MKVTMQDYEALFIHRSKFTRTETVQKCDGISPFHAHARAWLSLFETRLFQNDKDGWELVKLTDLSTGKNVTPVFEEVE